MTEPIVLVEEVEPGLVSRYGVIDGEQIEKNVYLIKDFIEKPAREEAPSKTILP